RSVLQLRSAAGRLMSPADYRPGAPRVAVMSYPVWKPQYRLYSAVEGSSLTVHGIHMTLVGIAPPGFYGDRLESDPPDFWMPIAIEPTMKRENSLLHLPATAWLYLIGRLRPGANPAQVSAHMTAELRQFLSDPANISPYEDKTKIKDQVINITSGAGGVNSMEDAKSGLYLSLI